MSACSALKTGTLLTAIPSALPEVPTRVFVTRAYSLVAVRKVSSLLDSRTVMVYDPTPLCFLTLVACMRVESPLCFDMAEWEEVKNDKLIGCEMCLSHVQNDGGNKLLFVNRLHTVSNKGVLSADLPGSVVEAFNLRW